MNRNLHLGTISTQGKAKTKKTHIHILSSKPAPGSLHFLSKLYNHKMTNRFLFKFEISFLISYDLNLFRN